MLKEIGSNFWLETQQIWLRQNSADVNLTDYKILGEDTVLLSTGRAAISFALKDIRRNNPQKRLRAIIPPYTCDMVVQPFWNENIEVFAYDINDRLFVEPNKFEYLLKTLQPNIVLIHRYFGFDTVEGVQKIIDDYRKNGVIFIEDRTQNLFSDFSSLIVDYIIGSFRKWGAIPDGGYCVNTYHKFDDVQRPEAEDRTLINKKLYAFQLKYDYMIRNKGNKNVFLKAYSDAESTLDREDRFYHMSQISMGIFNQMNIDELITRRRRNYTFVYDRLSDKRDIFILTDELSDAVVPLYIAIRSAKRDEIQLLLKAHNIYAPIVWPKPEKMPEVSSIVDKIYKEVLCLPIDQRYDLDDMERMVSLIDGFQG